MVLRLRERCFDSVSVYCTTGKTWHSPSGDSAQGALLYIGPRVLGKSGALAWSPGFLPEAVSYPVDHSQELLPSLHTHHPHVLNTNKQPFPKLSPLPPAPLPPLYSSLRNLPGKKNFIEVQLPHFLPLSLRNINPTQMSFYQPELLLFIQWDLASSSSPPPTHILSLPPSCPSISLPGRVFCSKLGFIQY